MAALSSADSASSPSAAWPLAVLGRCALGIVERLARTHAPQVIAFSDALFGASRRWTEAFLDGIERRELPLMFWAETRADLMTPELLERFKRCRFKLDFGLDAASVTMVERMEKSPDAERYLARSRELFQHANAIGLPYGVYLIFNFPGETPATSRQARKFIESIARGGAPMSGWLSCTTFFILPGTNAFLRMTENAAAHGPGSAIRAGGQRSATTMAWRLTCCRAARGAATRTSFGPSRGGTSA